MIEPYFFIPGNHPKLNEKLDSIKAENVIIDLEDAVPESELKSALTTVLRLKDFFHSWVRPVVFNGTRFQPEVILQLYQHGFRNFLIPKIRNLSQMISLENSLNNYVDLNKTNIILLVENPECLLNLDNIIQRTKFNLVGIGFGSQDFCEETGMSHIHNLLRLPRFLIFCAAKANNLVSIDIASMDITGKGTFQEDLKETIEMGYEGKFLIHPDQLEVINNFVYFSSHEVEEAKQIIEEYERLNKPAIFNFKNRAIEPPHIKHFQKIINWSIKNESK